MTTFCHSGTTGDTFSSMVAVKILGGGDLYLKLENLEKMVREKLGWPDVGRHKGRMTQNDYDIMKEFVEHQPYISSFKVWNNEGIDYDLDNAALHHETGFFPRNFSNQHALTHNIDTKYHLRQLQIDPWLECREVRKFPGRPIVIHRTPHYQEGNERVSSVWKNFIDRSLLEQAVFVGVESDHQYFEDSFKQKVPYYKTPDFMELARVIQGSELLITSMSSPCALAIGLGKTMYIETRKNEKHERLEVNYPFRLNIQYF